MPKDVELFFFWCAYFLSVILLCCSLVQVFWVPFYCIVCFLIIELWNFLSISGIISLSALLAVAVGGAEARWVKVREVVMALEVARRMKRTRKRNTNLPGQLEWGKRKRRQGDQMLPASCHGDTSHSTPVKVTEKTIFSWRKNSLEIRNKWNF